jgi:hypothetical protein
MLRFNKGLSKLVGARLWISRFRFKLFRRVASFAAFCITLRSFLMLFSVICPTLTLSLVHAAFGAAEISISHGLRSTGSCKALMLLDVRIFFSEVILSF